MGRLSRVANGSDDGAADEKKNGGDEKLLLVLVAEEMAADYRAQRPVAVMDIWLLILACSVGLCDEWRNVFATCKKPRVRGAGGVPCVNPPMLKSVGAENGSAGSRA